MAHFYLAFAIIAEVVGTSALKAAEGFTRPWPSLIVALGYGAAFYFMSLTLKTIPWASPMRSAPVRASSSSLSPAGGHPARCPVRPRRRGWG